MQVVISVGGRFHAFNLARELARRGALARLITSYPRFVVERFGVAPAKVVSHPLKELVARTWGMLPRFARRTWSPQWFLHEWFDRAAARSLVPSDIFVGWSSFALHSLRRARELGAMVVLERGSSHIEYQSDLLKEEYERCGILPPLGALPNPRIIEKELQEYREADRIAVPSEFVMRTFKEKGFPEEKLIHVPYGVDLSQFKQIAKQNNVFRVVFVGGIALRKGVHYLLQAFAELKLPKSELLLIGNMNEEMEPFLKKYAGTFRLAGHIPQRELTQYYSQGSVFVLPSIEEGLGLVQLQAMACGLPVIATTNTGAEDIVREGKDGFIIPIRDVETLKKKLHYFYEHPEEQIRMGQSAYTRVSSGFTWNDYGERIVKAYEHLLLSKKHRGGPAPY